VIDVNTHCDLVELLRTNPEYSFAAVVGSYIQTLREGAADAVSKIGATHLSFIDSDMMFPKDSIERLRSRDKDIIGANYIQRVEQEKWTAMINHQGVSSVGKTGIQEVDSIGMGLVLIKTDVLKKLPLPRFNMPWMGTYYLGEDIYFCELARKYGYKIWIDHDLSQNVHHVGKIKLGVDNYAVSEYVVPEIEGWMFPSEMEFLYNQAKQMDSIVELGSWKGRSTHALASGCKGTVWCVDHWLGSIGDRTKELSESEDIYSEFLKNTKEFKNINVLKMTTNEASQRFTTKSVDMVFIDAGHTYLETLSDINNWYPKAKKLICGHDYDPNNFPEVVRAVTDKFGKPDGVFGTIWFKKI
jgi:hypothetical protein